MALNSYRDALAAAGYLIAKAASLAVRRTVTGAEAPAAMVTGCAVTTVQGESTVMVTGPEAFNPRPYSHPPHRRSRRIFKRAYTIPLPRLSDLILVQNLLVN